MLYRIQPIHYTALYADPLDLSKRSKNITPIAIFNEEGDLKWNDELVKEIKALTQRTKPRAAGGR